MKLGEGPVFFLDLQTTGSRPGDSDILEMAWGDLRSEDITNVLVKPSTGFVPRRIQMITGIGDDDMVAAVDLPTAFAQLHAFLNHFPAEEKPLAVIHFCQFEKPFLLHAYELLQTEIPFEMLCTHQIAKRLMPNLPTRGIKGLAGYFGYNSGELKRSSSHVEATRFIWRGLTEALAQRNIETLEQLREWLTETPATKRKKYEYPMAKEKRLSLPDQPGVYRMISRWGEVLYVGKATSLHSRVNSYFRGQKNRDVRKLEMLTQAWDLLVTPCESPLEAALLETDEIKRLNPRYNISLKTGSRAIVFFNRDFTSMSYQQTEKHGVGPFSNALVMDSVRKLSEAARTGIYDPLMFFEPIDATLLEQGFRLFCERHGFTPTQFTSVRSILAVGLQWSRTEKFAAIAESFDESASADQSASEEATGDLADSPDAETDETEMTADDVLALTAEDLADKYERHFVRAAQAYRRARLLTRLLNSDIDFQLQSQGPHHFVKVRRGRLVTSDVAAASVDASAEISDNVPRFAWNGLGIDTYDRMSILCSELVKIQSQEGTVSIQTRLKIIPTTDIL
jgi:DNA polymerase-3 subunit epsilon